MKPASLVLFMSLLPLLAQTSVAPNNLNQNPQNEVNVVGFDGTSWGSFYQNVKKKFRTLATAGSKDPVTIVMDTPNREIMIKRKEIFYRYIFYKKPEATVENEADKEELVETTPEPAQNLPDQNTTEARFFFLESTFPLINANNLYDKLKKKYGGKSFTNLDKKNRGANVWDFNDGYLIQWIEPFKNKPYTRSLYYVSKTIREEIKNDLQEYQFRNELKAIKNLIP